MDEIIEYHMDNSFHHIMTEFLIEDFYLIKEHNRVLCVMSHPWDRDLDNMICLFPPLTNSISKFR